MGVRLIRYTVNDNPAQTVQGSTASFTLEYDGIYTINYFAKDLAGNAEAAHELIVRIDRGIPYFTITTDVDPATGVAQMGQNVTITVVATEQLAMPPLVSLSSDYGNSCLETTSVPVSLSSGSTYTGTFTVPSNR